MTPAARATEIAMILGRDEGLKGIQVQPLLISEIPLSSAAKDFGLIINWFIGLPALSLSVLWRITIPLMKQLYKAGKLTEFRVIEIQVVAVDQGNSKRVLGVRSAVDDIGKLPITTSRDLLSDDWNTGTFACYWYCDRRTVAA